MERERLLQTLRALEAELSQSNHVDPETVDQLRELTERLERKLDTDADEPDDAPQPSSGLHDLMLRYEAEHPQLSASIGRVADALAAMGF